MTAQLDHEELTKDKHQQQNCDKLVQEQTGGELVASTLVSVVKSETGVSGQQQQQAQDELQEAIVKLVNGNRDNVEDDDDDDKTVLGTSPSRDSSATSIASVDELQQNEPDVEDRSSIKTDPTRASGECSSGASLDKHELHNPKSSGKQNPFCDFCLGTADKNRRTRLPEELISCSNCGSSGHPSCLRFSDNMRRSVQKYKWQCIECKTCSTCNQADHEDQLLFCDDCDRSYHTYCLSPRLDHPPEGNWTCKPCLSEYYTDG
jgi:hypothetical protein